MSMDAQDRHELAYAQQYFRAGRQDFAKSLLVKLYAKHPKQGEISELLGYIAGNEGDFQSARQYLAAAHEAKPKDASILYYLGYCAQQTNDHAEAIVHLQRSLELMPSLVDSMRNLSISLLAVEQPQEALTQIERAYQIEPNSAGVLYDYANALFANDVCDEALRVLDQLQGIEPSSAGHLLKARIYQKQKLPVLAADEIKLALQLNAQDPIAWTNLAALFFSDNNFEASVQASEKALSLDDRQPLVWLNYAAALLKLKNNEASLNACERVIQLDVSNGQAWLNKAMAHGSLLQTAQAINAYQQAKKLGVKASQIDYALAAYGAGQVPSASPQDYVTQLFDNYADSFDQHLLHSLEYKVPQVMQRLLTAHCNQAKVGRVLDLGCGTGLFEPMLRQFAEELIGVDLSPKMLAVAKEKGGYHELIASDVVAYLAKSQQPLRLVVALDVFVYIGDLGDIFLHLSRLLEGGGDFGFSVEKSSSDQAYQLLPSLRYAHSHAYISDLADKHKFNVVVSEPMTSRMDRGLPIQGLAYVLRKI